MDGVIDLLQSTRLSGGVFLDAEFSAPWCVFSGVTAEEVAPFVAAPTHIISYHYICAGRMVLELDDHEPVPVESGEVVLLPHNEAHRLASAPGLPPVSAEQFLEHGDAASLSRIVYGGGGETTRMLCGFLASEVPNDPVLRVLPRVMKVRIADAPSSAWIESTMRFGAQEIAGGLAGSPALLARLAELLFVEAVRRYIASQPPGECGWQAGIFDPMIGRALALLHRRLGQRWTAEDLAHAVGMSRSAFADRFTRIMGESPMRYLAAQRLQAAARRLEASSDSIARIAFEVGYESEAAFNRAFRRAFGAPPATWRAGRNP
ncbi:MAG TPA: AraC family transcriptional regulator [Steroidobacteraceae bacterium]|nr:AraC family transcriptional regulator [Steroidobacteraceae bacterium]